MKPDKRREYFTFFCELFHRRNLIHLLQYSWCGAWSAQLRRVLSANSIDKWDEEDFEKEYSGGHPKQVLSHNLEV